jgi:hypothetical protein
VEPFSPPGSGSGDFIDNTTECIKLLLSEMPELSQRLGVFDVAEYDQFRILPLPTTGRYFLPVNGYTSY